MKYLLYALWFLHATALVAHDQTNFTHLRAFGVSEKILPAFSGVVEGSDQALYGVSGFPFGESSLYRFDKNSKSLTRISVLPGNPRFASPIVTSASGLIYVGGIGLTRHNPLTKTTEFVLKSPFQEVLTLAPGPGGSLFGILRTNQGASLFRVNDYNLQVSFLKDLPTNELVSFNIHKILYSNDSFLYGITYDGGIAGAGIVFRISTNGTGFTLLTDFSNYPPYHNPIELMETSDGLLYGICFQGSNNVETIFRLDKGTGAIQPIRAFTEENTFFWDIRTLTEGTNGHLYGTIYSEGQHGGGSIFELRRDGAYRVVQHFTGIVGTFPLNGLSRGSNGVMYGATYSGGASQQGTIFSFDPAEESLQLLHSFNYFGDDARNPSGQLLLSAEGYLYGTTTRGGSNNAGTVFRLRPDGTDYSILHNFNYRQKDGALPVSGLIEGSDGALYGTTRLGGSNFLGTIFKIAKDGSDYKLLHQFPSFASDGSRPTAKLLAASDQRLYGTTLAGGSHSQGIIFRMNPDGSNYEVLHNFEGQFTSSGPGSLVEGQNGSLYGSLGIWDNTWKLYGISKDGANFTILNHMDWPFMMGEVTSLFYSNGWLLGAASSRVFKVRTDGTEFTDLTYESSGDYFVPSGLFLGVDDRVYVTHSQGFYSAGQITYLDASMPNGYQTLYRFISQDGRGIRPPSAAIQGPDLSLYGVVHLGGPFEGGAVYKLSHAPTPLNATLKIELRGTEAIISWPSNLTDAFIEIATSLTSPDWFPLSMGLLEFQDNRLFTRVPLNDFSTRYFRLRR